MGRSQRRSDSARQERREEGEKRNEAWRSLTTQQKLDVIASRTGNSTRQRSKLEAK